jgi:purine-nucleoside phosphorylase
MSTAVADPVAAPYDAARSSAAVLADRTGVTRHHVAVVLGSGWRSAGDELGEITHELPVAALGGVPEPSVPGHGSTVRSIRVGERRVLAFSGRVHLYEGHHPNVVVHAVRTAVAAGVTAVVLTNAAGGVRADLAVGEPVLIADHLNLTGTSPLIGPADPRLGPRFVDLTAAYAPGLRAAARAVEPGLPEGVYAGFSGPAFETPAEVRMAAVLGADLVGMSTVHETVAAVHAGAEVLGLSLVTNRAAGLGGEGLDHREVLDVAAAAAPRLGSLLAGIVARVAEGAP